MTGGETSGRHAPRCTMGPMVPCSGRGLPRRERTWPSAFALGLLLVVTGCADRTAILIEVTSTDLTIPNDIDSLTIAVRTEFEVMFEETYPVSATWPHSLAITPPPREGVGVVRIDVTGNLGGVPVTRRVASTSWTPGATRRVTVVLTRTCLGILCPDGYDCVNGVCCQGAECLDADAGTGDGGLDGGLDAGGLDASDLDGGEDAPLDAPMPLDVPGDAFTPMDAGLDAGRDAGMDAGMDAGLDAPPGAAPMLLFSEYVEGSSNNKAVEIRNYGPSGVDLAASMCRIIIYSNGSSTASRNIVLSTTIAAGGTYVVCHASAGTVLAPSCDFLSMTPLDFNGNDAVELRCGTTTLDVIGQIGFDPLTQWGTGLTSTLDNTLRRRCPGTVADVDGSDAFDPAASWVGFDPDTFAGLRSPTCAP
jgi:hypothetical protein